MLASPTATWISRGVLAAVMLVYGASKVPHVAGLAESIHNYRILPVEFENLPAAVLPWIEIVAAAALVVRRWLPGGTILTGAMLAVFIAAIASALVRGLDINCGCFTLSEKSPGYDNLWRTLILDLVLLSMTAHVWLVSVRSAWSGGKRAPMREAQ